MIRKSIPQKWRLIIGAISVLMMILMYTWLSETRQAAARADQAAVATKRLGELAEEKKEKQEALAKAEDSSATTLRESLRELDEEISKFKEQRDNPSKTDLTVPSWSQLYQDGLMRASSPQGRFQKKEVWIYEDFKATGIRLTVALLVGIFVSVSLGILMGCFDPLEAFFMPPFALLTKIPATAVLPIFFVLIQINFWMYIAIIVFGLLPSLAQTISASVRKDVPEELVFKAYTLGASQAELIWNVIYKQVLPRILDAARLQIGPALVLLVAAEWMVAGEGIGYRLRLFYQRTDMTVVFVYVIILGILGLALDYGLIWLRRKLCPWFGE